MPQLLLSQLSLQDLVWYRTAKLLTKHPTQDKSHPGDGFIKPGEIRALLTGVPGGLLGLGDKVCKGAAGQLNSSENQRQLRTIPWRGAASALQAIGGEKKYPRMAPGRGVLQKNSGEGGTEVSGFQKPLPGELEVAMKDLWKPKGEVFLPCPCSLHPAPSASGGLGAIPKDTREIQSRGSWGRAELGSHHMTGEFHFRDNKSRLFPSAEVPSLEGFETQTPNPAADCGSGSPRIKPGELQWGSPRAAEPELPGASIAAFPTYFEINTEIIDPGRKYRLARKPGQ